MERERRITAPAGHEIDKVEIVDGAAVITFKEKGRKLPKSWEEFCEMFPTKEDECYIDSLSEVSLGAVGGVRRVDRDENLLPDRATAEAVLALCQLIQLRNAYNGDWVPDWTDRERKYTIDIFEHKIWSGDVSDTPSILYFKTRELRDEFLRFFRPLIEKLKPLYGIKEGGEE